MWGPSAAIQHAAQAVTSPAQRAASRLEALLAFLAASGARTARLVPADMLRLSTDAVSRAEAAMVAAYPTVAAAAAAAAAAARPTSAAERGGRDVRPQLDVSLPRRGVVAPLGPAVMLGGLTAAHAPGERVLLLRGAGPAPFGARGLVLASQGGTCEVLFEREGFCNTGRFAQLRTMRSAVLPIAALPLPLLPLPTPTPNPNPNPTPNPNPDPDPNLNQVLPTAALLNLSRPPLARGHAAAAAAAASYGASLRAAGGGGGAPQGKRYEGAPSNMFLLLDAEYLQVSSK